MKKNELRLVSVSSCVLLKRNPQYLTARQLAALERSIERDGFVAPILIRPIKGKRFEVVSGNHRFIAAQRLGYEEIPAVVSRMTTKQAQRLSVNLNMIHGDPTAELLAPFLAEMPDDVLADVHLEDSLLRDLLDFDARLAGHLKALTLPASITRAGADTTPLETCECPKCGRKHFAAVQPNTD